MTDKHTASPDDSADTGKDPLDTFIDAVRSGYEDIRRNHFDAGGSQLAVHAHPSTLRRIVHETDQFLDFQSATEAGVASPTVATIEGVLRPGMTVVESHSVPDGIIIVANPAYMSHGGAVSVERLADHR